VRSGWAKRLARQRGPRASSFPALQEAVDEVFESRIGDVSGRGKLGADMREIWTMQPRFEKRTPASALSLVAQPRFRAGFDFLRLRANVGEIDAELATWWETFSLADEAARDEILETLRAQKLPPRKRVVKTVSTDASQESAESPSETTASLDADAPRKRRRRRRKPNDGGTQSGGVSELGGDDA